VSAEKLEKKADDLRNNGQGLKAIASYSEAKAAYEAADRADKAAECQHMIGVSYKVENDIAKAILELNTAADMCEKLGNKIRVGQVERDIGICYAYNEDFDTALTWLEKSRQHLTSEAGPELGITEAKIGLMHMHKNELPQADAWMARGLATIRSTDAWFYEMTALLHIGTLDLKRDKDDEAATALWAGVGLIFANDAQDGQQRRLAQLYGLLAHSYLGLQNYNQAKHLFARAVDMLDLMAANVAAVVYDDIAATGLLAAFEHRDKDFFHKYHTKVERILENS